MDHLGLSTGDGGEMHGREAALIMLYRIQIGLNECDVAGSG